MVYAVAADPDSPGAYRYDPDSSDPTRPESDPRSPRYEPPHLRHRPGDTWIIDRDRPHDPHDPGPFGSPDWSPDTRTGRHRRGELPDLHREAEPIRPRSDRATRPSPGSTSEGTEGRRRSTSEGAGGRRRSTSEGTEERRPSPGRIGNEPPEPPERPRRRFWEDANEDRYDFGKLREDAWARFIAGSQELHRAHSVATTTFADRWVQFWVTMRAFLFQVLGIDSAEKSAPLESPTVPLQTMPSPATPSARPLPIATPSQGRQRTNPISPYLGHWERHFDERQAFREAVAL